MASRTTNGRGGFTLTEMLIVVSIIAVLMGILLPALSGVVTGGRAMQSSDHLRQITTWMRLYSDGNRDIILPSQFDYSNDPDPGKVRSGPVAIGLEHQGTWADILWTLNDLGNYGDPSDPSKPAYKYDSPDKELYEPANEVDRRVDASDIENPLRSTMPNTRNAPLGATPQPRPYGDGAQEAGLPGYFAANNFFDARPAADGGNGWFTNGQIRFPAQSLYLIDSFAGEIIEDDCAPYFFPTDGSVASGEVDFRYDNSCLTLFLDGHIESRNQFLGLDDLQQGPNSIRIQGLDRRSSPPPCP